MQDVTGKQISIDDSVVFMSRMKYGSKLCVGRVVGFSAKMVRIVDRNNNASSYAPHNIAITHKQP